jgi:antitoxin ParD1/3/4
MGAIRRVTIAMPAKMAADLRQRVADGEYDSTSEIVQEALRDWERSQEAEQRDLEELPALVRGGMESGPGIPAEQVYADVRARIMARMTDG